MGADDEYGVTVGTVIAAVWAQSGVKAIDVGYDR